MRVERHVIAIEYKMFDPGEKVVATSNRSPLDKGKVYTVVSCHAPLGDNEDSVVFVEGMLTGVSTEYVTAYQEPKEASNDSSNFLTF